MERHCRYRDVTVKLVTLDSANLENAILSDAQTEGAKFDAAIMPDGHRMP